MALSGFLKQSIRAIKHALHNLRRKLSRSKKGKNEPIVLHRSWKNPKKSMSKKTPQVIIKSEKKRIPGYLMIKRVLAGILFLLNFIMSQFLLGTAGAAGIGTFIFFMANAFILADYLWKTRRKED